MAMAHIYRDKKDLPNALTQFEKAAQEYVGQGYKQAIAQTELGRAYEEKGDRTNADKYYLKAVGSGEYTAAYFYYGKFMLGDPKTKDKGKLTLQQYVKEDPHGQFVEDAKRL